MFRDTTDINFADFRDVLETLFRGSNFQLHLFKTFYAFMLPFPQLKQPLVFPISCNIIKYTQLDNNTPILISSPIAWNQGIQLKKKQYIIQIHIFP